MNLWRRETITSKAVCLTFRVSRRALKMWAAANKPEPSAGWTASDVSKLRAHIARNRKAPCTEEVARELKINSATVYLWARKEGFRLPPLKGALGRRAAIRAWRPSDIRRLKAFMARRYSLKVNRRPTRTWFAGRAGRAA